MSGNDYVTEMCEPFRSLLDDYLDQMLDAEQQREFELHLNDCSTCRNEVLLHRTLESTARDYAASLTTTRPLPIFRAERVNTNLRRRKQLVLVSLAVAASLVLVFAVSRGRLDSNNVDVATHRESAHKNFDRTARDAVQVVRPESLESPELNTSRTVFLAMQSPSHVSVVETDEEEFTLVMLYPKFEDSILETNNVE